MSRETGDIPLTVDEIDGMDVSELRGIDVQSLVAAVRASALEVERLRERVTQADDAHGKTVRAIGRIFGITDDATLTNPTRFMAAMQVANEAAVESLEAKKKGE